MSRSNTVLFASLLVVPALTGCGVGSSADGGGDALVFGEQESVCAAVVLTNDDTDEAAASAGSACFLTEVAAGRPVVWDVRAVTVEGDPIPVRYDYDGDVVTITDDSRRDEFGNDGVSVRTCTGVRGTGWLPEGTGCSPVDGPGFADAGLD